jgi:hypothetical protein
MVVIVIVIVIIVIIVVVRRQIIVAISVTRRADAIAQSTIAWLLLYIGSGSYVIE